MDQVIRILAFVTRLLDCNLRYKIAYRRNIYYGYDMKKGDEIDQAIFNFFNQKNPSQIGWECIGIDIGKLNLTHVLNSFTPRNIPVIITPCLDSLSQIELDYLQDNDTSFQIINKQVTLFYRSNMVDTNENWIWLPTEIRIEINYKTYIQMAKTIFSY